VAAALAACSQLEMRFSGSSGDDARLGRAVPGWWLSLCEALKSGIYLGIGLQGFASQLFSDVGAAGLCMDAILRSGLAEGPVPPSPLLQPFLGVSGSVPQAQAGGFAPKPLLEAVPSPRLRHWA